MGRWTAALLCAAALGCGGAGDSGSSTGTGSANDGADDGGTDSGDGTTGTATGGGDDGGTGPEVDECDNGTFALDDTVVRDLVITLDPAAWDAMIQEAAASPEYEAPPKTYHPAQMTLDGETTPGDVGFRLKGHYSLITAEGHRFPLKIDFDRYVQGQRFDGLKKLQLHPSRPDDGDAVREWLSYGTFREFGIASPRVAFANVTVNGEDLGFYGLVEQVDGLFMRCHFDEPYGDLYKPEEPEGTLEWRGPTIDDYPWSQHKWPDMTDHEAFLNLVNVINNQPYDQWGDVIDRDGVLTYFAANAVVGMHDYYATTGHNYYLYEINPGQFTMLPWDMNGSQEDWSHVCGTGRNTAEFPMSHHLLADPDAVARLIEIVQEMIAGPSSVTRLHERLDTVMPVIEPELEEWIEGDLRDAFQPRIDALQQSMMGLTVCPEQT